MTSKHTIEIDLNNWFDFQKKCGKQIEDPINEQFNWWYYCGVKSKEEKKVAINDYNKFKNMLPKNTYEIYKLKKGREERILKFKSKLVRAASKEPGFDVKYIDILSTTLDSFSIDMERVMKERDTNFSLNDPESKKKYKMCFNVIFGIYSTELNKSTTNSYTQGECAILLKIYNLVLTYKGQKEEDEIECLLYHIYHTLLFKIPIKKMMLTPPYKISQDIDEKVTKISPYIFFNWLFIVMFIKKNKNKWKKIIEGKDQVKIDNMFSEAVMEGWRGWKQNLNTINPTDFREIIGNVLVKKDITMFFSYIISYWSGYENTNATQWDDTNNTGNLIEFFVMNVLSKDKEIYSKKLTDTKADFDKIYNYFKKNFEKIVLICTEESFRKKIKFTSEGIPLFFFKLPRKFIKENSKIWGVKYEKIKKKSHSKRGGNKTLKKYNRKLNRTIKLK